METKEKRVYVEKVEDGYILTINNARFIARSYLELGRKIVHCFNLIDEVEEELKKEKGGK